MSPGEQLPINQCFRAWSHGDVRRDLEALLGVGASRVVIRGDRGVGKTVFSRRFVERVTRAGRLAFRLDLSRCRDAAWLPGPGQGGGMTPDELLSACRRRPFRKGPSATVVLDQAAMAELRGPAAVLVGTLVQLSEESAGRLAVVLICHSDAEVPHWFAAHSELELVPWCPDESAVFIRRRLSCFGIEIDDDAAALLHGLSRGAVGELEAVGARLVEALEDSRLESGEAPGAALPQVRLSGERARDLLGVKTAEIIVSPPPVPIVVAAADEPAAPSGTDIPLGLDPVTLRLAVSDMLPQLVAAIRDGVRQGVSVQPLLEPSASSVRQDLVTLEVAAPVRPKVSKRISIDDIDGLLSALGDVNRAS